MSSAAPGGPSGPSQADLDHTDLRPNMIAAAWTAWTIALVFVILRFWTRSRIVHALGLADWCILLSLTAALGYGISVIEQCKYGMGLHVWDIDLLDNSRMMESWWFSLLFYELTLALTKVSICLLYLTIFTFEWARRATYVVLAVVAITSLWATITTLTYCIPLRSVWDPMVVATYCQDQIAWWVKTGIMMVTDLMIFILPIPIVWPIKLPRRQKLMVVGVFAVGFFVCLVSLIRLIMLIPAKSSVDPDFTFTGVNLMYWTVIEVHTAIVVACAMTLKPLLARLFPGLLDTSRRRGRSDFEPSAAVGSRTGNGRAPPTIGSRPLRYSEEGCQGRQGQQGKGQQQAGMQEWQKRWQQLGSGGGGEIGGENGDEVGEGQHAGVKPISEGVAGKEKEGEVNLTVHGPWSAGSDTGSDRTGDELGRKMSAKSMG